MAGADADLAIRVLLRGERNFRKAERSIARIGAASALAEKKFASMGASSNKLGQSLNKSMTKFRRVMDYWSSAVKGIGMMITKTLGLATKFFVAEFALMAAAMIGVHALLGIGKWLLKGYHGAVKMVAGGAAAATAALAGLASALREQQVAMWGYKGTNIGFKELGSNMASVRTVMRGLHRDSNLASAGMANLNAAFAAVNQKSTFTSGSQAMLNNLMDFASAGQPLDKGMKSAGEFIGVLQDVESSWSDIKKAAEAMGEPAKKAIEEAGKAGISTAKGLMEAINSGQFALFGGVAGQWDNVNDTLISRFKATFTSLRSDFADLGDVFLAPIKDGLQHITNSFQRLFIRIRSDIGHFGAGPFVDTLVSAAEKLEEGMARLIHHWLPMAQGMFDRIGGWWTRFTDGWSRLKANMEPLLRGAAVLEDMFMNIIRPIGDYLANTFGSFSGLLEDNKAQFLAFGTELGAVLTSMLSLQAFFKELLFESMPHFMLIMKGLRDIIGAVEGMLKGISGMMGGLGSGLAPFMMLMGMRTMGAGMRGTKGSIVSLPQKTQVMNVQSSQTNITGGTTGATAGGQMGPKGMHPGGGLYSQRPGHGAGGAPIPGSARVPGGAQPPAGHPGYRNTRWSRGAYRMAGGYNDPNQQRLGRIGRMQRGFGNMRNNTRMGQGVSRMQNSMGAKMGVGLGMGMLSQMAPEEMQGSLALGGMVGMFNPLAGVGIGLGGAALKSQSTAAGALSGGAAGAAIGTMIAPGVGTVVGGMIGAVAGGIMGSFGRQRALEKRVKESGENAAEQIYASMISGIDSAIVEFGRAGMTGKRTRTALNLDNTRVNDIMGRLKRFQDTGSFEPEVTNAGTLDSSEIDPFWYLSGTDRDLYRAGDPFENILVGQGSKTSLEWAEQMVAQGDDFGGDLEGFLANARSNPASQLEKQADAAKALVSDIVGQASIMGLTLSDTQVEEAYKEPLKFLEGMAPLTDQFKAAQDVVGKYESRMETWTKTMGLSEEEVLVLADAVGVNLYDAFEDFGDMTKNLAQGMITTTEQMRGAWGNFLADEIVRPLQAFTAAEKAPNLINELGRGARESFLAGEFDEASAGELVISMVQALTDAGGAEYAALMVPKMFGAEGMAFQKGSPLEGMEHFFAGLGELFNAIVPKSGELQQDMLNQMLVGNLMGAGYGVTGVSAGALHRALADPANRDAFEAYMTSEDIGDSAMFGDAQAGDIQAFLRSIGLSDAVVGDFQTTAQLEANSSAVMLEAGGLQIRAAQAIIAHLGQGSRGIPAPGMEPASDTNQPIGDVGSTMGKTMSKYNMLNGQMPGQRTITSGYRNYALGSVRSDHVMGRALDVVGQNLSGLANLTNAQGGFAEMHGSGKGRHLHMVPNAAEGDVLGTPGGSGSTTYNYSINVAGGPNADSGEVAELVMAAIQQTSRDSRERA